MVYHSIPTEMKNMSNALTAIVSSLGNSVAAENWTKDFAGERGTFEKHMKALDRYVRNHPARHSKTFGLKHLSAFDAQNVLKIIADKRGRVSPYDIQILQSVMLINQLAGRSTEPFNRLLKTTARNAEYSDKTKLAINAELYRTQILGYTSQPNSNTRSRKFHEARDKFVLALLMHIPIRLNSLHLLKRSWIINGSTFSLPASATKVRKPLSFDLPLIVKTKLDDYLALCPEHSEALIVNIAGDAIKKKSLYRFIHRKTEKILGFSLGPHAFRAVVGSWVAKKVGSEAGADVLAISPAVFRKHYFLSDSSEKLKNAMKKLEAFENA